MSETTLTKHSEISRNGLMLNKKNTSIFFPVPIEIVSNRLSSAFSTPISKKTGLLFATVIFDGQIIGNNFKISYSSYGKSTVFYTTKGELVAQPNGTLLQMTTYQKIPLWQIILMLFGVFAAIGFLLKFQGFIGLPLVLLTILFGSIALPLFFLLNLSFSGWNASVATNSVRNLLTEIIRN